MCCIALWWKYLALLGPSWFRISQLTYMEAIGLQKPHAMTEVGELGTWIDIFLSRLWAMATSLQDQNTWNTFPGSEYLTIFGQ